MQLDRYEDAAAFLDAAGAWLSAAEVENSVMLGVAASLADGRRTLAQAPYFAVAVSGDRIDCCAMRTPPHNILISDGTPRGAAALAAETFKVLGQLPGVNGPRQAAATFSEAWAKSAGTRAFLQMQQRLHRIERVDEGLPAAPGGLREASARDRDLAVQWARAFLHEAIPGQPDEVEQGVDRNLRAGALHVWDDGGPVSICASAAGTKNVARVNFVYTPPELRGRGYATAAVSALTRRLLADGSRYCCLYTDLANPTSNGIYHRIGYRPVCDIDQYSFEQR